MRLIPMFLLFVPTLGLALGCGGKMQSPDTTVRGTTQALTYPSAPVAVVARDEGGRSLTTQLAGGAFALSLPKGHTYSLAVVTANGEVPVAFPRTSGRLDATFSVRSKGANVNLGALRFANGAPASGFRFAQSSVAAPGSGQVDCTDCVDDPHDVQCDDGSHGNDNADEQNGGPQQADRTHDLSVAEHNAPESIDGCGGDNEQEGNNNDGEH